MGRRPCPWIAAHIAVATWAAGTCALGLKLVKSSVLGIAETCASPAFGVCCVCGESPEAPGSRLVVGGALGQPGVEMFPGGRFLPPFPGTVSTSLLIEHPRCAWGIVLLKFQRLALSMPRINRGRKESPLGAEKRAGWCGQSLPWLE